MEITFHLNTGGVVVLDLEKVSEAQAAEHQNGWLWDKNGAGVDLAAVVAIVPGNTASGDPIYPDTIVDGRGDEWKHTEKGQYRHADDPNDAITWSFAYIKECWGIQS